MLSHQAAELRLAQVQTSLITTHPFFAILLFHLAKVPDPTAKTMWTDGTRLGYNPAYVLSLPRDHLKAVLAHEVAHVAGLHPFRQGTRANGAWNVACDHVANAVVLDAGLVLPDGALAPIRDRCPEELYVAPPPPPVPAAGSQPQGPDSSTGGVGAGAGSATPPAGGGVPDTPDSATGGDGADLGCGEVRPPANPDGTALSQADRAKRMEEMRIAVHQALTAARRAGNVPAGIERLAAETLEPQIPWREVLARFIDDQARHDYTWSRPNRRFLADGILLPSLWSPAYGRIVMGCDTSGSVSKEQLTDICGEVIGAMEAYQERGQSPTLTVAWFDSKVYPQTVEAPDELKPQGGGGTKFGGPSLPSSGVTVILV
jgi:predicted metal-dependent peptidase